MNLFELFRATEFTRDEVELRVKNSKSPEEKAKWGALLQQYRIALSEEKLIDYLNRLEKKEKIKKLGGGAFGRVFQHPQFHNVVVKVYRQKDRVYAKFLNWVMHHQNNPYAPQVIEQTMHRSPSGDKYNIVFLEKLTPIKSINKLVSELEKALNLTKDQLALDEIGDAMDGYEMDEVYNVISKYVRKGQANKDFAEIWKAIQSLGKENFDLHEGNAMMRGSQLVITDPAALEPTSWLNDQ